MGLVKRSGVGSGEREEKTPIRDYVCQCTKFPQKDNDFGQAHFFLPPPPRLSSFALAPILRVTIFTLPDIPPSQKMGV